MGGSRRRGGVGPSSFLPSCLGQLWSDLAKTAVEGADRRWVVRMIAAYLPFLVYLYSGIAPWGLSSRHGMQGGT